METDAPQSREPSENQTLFEFGTNPDLNAVSHEVFRRRPVLIALDGKVVNERHVLRRQSIVIGRDFNCDLILNDNELSRRHAQVEWENFGDDQAELPHCYIEDLGSTNGTSVNGEKIGSRCPLRDGDQIRLGKTVIGFYLKDERVLELDQMLVSMALHDTLTGAYKRDYFMAQLHREFDRSSRYERPFSVLMIDVDNFKAVNDEYGHLCGDEALRMVAERIRSSLREGDICARFGGEEFVVLLPETGAEGASQAAERIRRQIASNTFTTGRLQDRKITISIGVASLRPDYRDKMELLDAADTALYAAKQAGRNRVCTDMQLRDKAKAQTVRNNLD